ncbi:TonB-dependent receptor plug domain-containing protein [Polaribacter aquimarinus]|uniref:TonB-dependent receptor n=1 Tax=Polaribacter aquimarinus TaxID=2100726 RepID=A0A2U2JBL9_9FLAO|nr:TonB-dependent receptor [Polaribacter aquimarinus]PWG05733.1 TonB-dependent receptor [Polaribacter aquimarinus]
MRIKITLVLGLISCIFQTNAQTDTIKRDTLNEVVITTNRIDIPFKKNSRTIQIVTADIIKKSAATNIADVLQQVAGVDIRRRGTAGSQADLYIRGGGFDQTLLLIDGIKMDDAQTGHHTLNAALPLEVIERIEIIKGPAARVYGQNAFTGAINIVTKKKLNNNVSANVEAGSFGQLNGSVTLEKDSENTTLIAHIGTLTSDGYRVNSDYKNYNYFVKGVFNKQIQPINVIATFFDKKFGAQNFYTPESFGFNEYEETQNSLIGVSTSFKSENFKITPRVYWRRGQDIFLLKRDDPAFYRNLHITNKVGAEANASYNSNLGITGFGLDVSRVSISSNNLGQRDRIMANLFLEHRFNLGNFDITPGVAVTYFSDFKFHAFPGLDIGYRFSEKFKVYGNIGTTFRIPTYTDLYYNDRSTSGNPNLQPEEAFAQEIGFKYTNGAFSGNLSFFNRDSDNLIDFIRPDANTNVFTATNIANVNTKGFEVDANYGFKINEFQQNIAVGYTLLEDDIIDQNRDLSRYSLNTLKHHFTTRLRTQLFKNVSQNIIYKHAERLDGQSYNVWDASIMINLNKLEFTFTANNIFSADYVESGFVPMPASNILFGLRYNF